jgi:hypothetical protein
MFGNVFLVYCRNSGTSDCNTRKIDCQSGISDSRGLENQRVIKESESVGWNSYVLHARQDMSLEDILDFFQMLSRSLHFFQMLSRSLITRISEYNK